MYLRCQETASGWQSQILIDLSSSPFEGSGNGCTLTRLFFLILHLMMPNVTVTEPRAEIAAINSRSRSKLGIVVGTAFGSVQVLAT